MESVPQRYQRQFRIPRNRVVDLDKLNAALRQLETAIELQFYSGDPVAIHTLACASYNVFRDIAVKAGIKDPAARIIEIACPPEKQKKAHADIRATQNFFKHADRDKDEILRFRTAANAMWLWWASILHREILKGSRSNTVSIWLTWFALKNPKFARLFSAPYPGREDIDLLNMVRSAHPSIFYEFMVCVVGKRRLGNPDGVLSAVVA